MSPIDERKEDFRNRLRAWCDMNDPKCIKYPVWLRKEFWEYWTATNDNGRKMYFEMEKKWNTGLRLATWARNCQKDPRWNKQEKKKNIDYGFNKKRFKEGQMVPGFDYGKFNVNK